MQFTGRVTSDAEVRTVKNDRKVTGFTVAVNKRWKDKNGDKQEKTVFVDCAYWINSGVAEYLKKGTVVEISGWVEAQSWVNRDGDAKAGLRCDVETLKLYSFQNAKNEGKRNSKKSESAKSGAGNEDNLPF
jgi:single-strand DNA-binding protein